MNIIELKLLLKVSAHFKIMNHDIMLKDVITTTAVQQPPLIM